MFRIGVIGLGTRIHEGVLPPFFQLGEEIRVTAVADPATTEVQKKIQEKPEFYADDIRLYENADDMLKKEDLDGIIIGTLYEALGTSIKTNQFIRIGQTGLGRSYPTYDMTLGFIKDIGIFING